MHDFGNKAEFTTLHYVNSWRDDERDTTYFFGRITIRKDAIYAIEEDVQAFNDHCMLCCNIFLKSGEVILVKENYYELTQWFSTVS